KFATPSNFFDEHPGIMGESELLPNQTSVGQYIEANESLNSQNNRISKYPQIEGHPNFTRAIHPASVDSHLENPEEIQQKSETKFDQSTSASLTELQQLIALPASEWQNDRESERNDGAEKKSYSEVVKANLDAGEANVCSILGNSQQDDSQTGQ